jgi:hypothetical protein
LAATDGVAPDPFQTIAIATISVEHQAAIRLRANRAEWFSVLAFFDH